MRSMVRAACVAVLAAISGSCTSFLGWQPDPVPGLRGPIPTRTQEPIKLTYLGFRPRSARTQAEGKLALSVISQYSNTFENGYSTTESVVIDGEFWRNSAVARYGLSPSNDIEIEIPIMYATSGFLDPLIEYYHQIFGFPNGGRDERAQYTYEVSVFTNGKEAYNLEGNRVGLGDIPVIFTQQLLEGDGDRPSLAVRFGIEFPTGSEPAGFGNGKFDVGGGVLAQHSFGRWTITGAVDYVYAGNAASFAAAGVEPAPQFDGQIGVEYPWSDDTSLLGGLVLDSPVTRDIQLKEIDNPILSLDLGVAWDIAARSQLFLGLTEDLISQSGPDISFNLIWKSGF